MALTKLISLARCRPNAGTFVEAAGHELAVFLLADPDRVYVLDNACPHAGGNLSGGDIVGAVVRCPSHHWEFGLDHGVCSQSDRARVHRYPAQIRDGAVWVDLAPAYPGSEGE
jgi:nitrite reductase/ring-hydroxylating ferredoxin subunit